MSMALVLIPLLALVVSMVLTRILMQASWLGSEWLDHPNDRSLHQRPTPRSGGIAITSGVLLAGLCVGSLFGQQHLLYLGLGASVLVAVAYWDDRGHVAPHYRLLAQVVSAFILVSAGMPEVIFLPGIDWRPNFLANVVLLTLFVVWMTNLYNFMDGMDGLAAGMAVLGFGTLALLAADDGVPGYVLFNLGVAAAAAGFLRYNFPPAGIFMGDIGSTLLGFLAAGSIIWGVEKGLFSALAGLLPFAVFVVDATVTLMQRIWRRERIWEAHRSHYYQRMAGAGWSHRRVVLLEYGLMALACTAGLAFDHLKVIDQVMLIAGLGGIFGLAMWAVFRWERST